MAVKPEYKFKPYTPTRLKMASTASTEDKTLKSLQTQRANLDARLRAEGINPDTLGGEFDNRNLIEKTLNLRPDQGVLMDFFEIINRPVEAVKAGILAGAKGESILEGAWEGISGNVNERGYTRGSEFLEELGAPVPTEGLAGFILDVGVDIALDPLTYVPAGFFLKGFKKLTAKTGKGVINAAGEAQEALIRRLAVQFPDEPIDDVLRRLSDSQLEDVLFEGNSTLFNEDIYLNPKKYTKAQIKANKKAYKNSIEALKSRGDTLRDIIQGKAKSPFKPTKANPDGIYEYVKTEMKVYDDIAESIEAVDPGNIKVVMTTSQNRMSDIIIYKRYADTDIFTKVGKLEVKKFAGAMGPTATMEVTGKGLNRGIRFKQSKKAFQFSDTLSTRLDDFLNKTIDGKTIKSRALDIYDSKKGALEIADLVKGNKTLSDEYANLVFDMMEEKGVQTLVFGASEKPLYISLEQARKYLKVGRGIELGSGSGKIAKIKTGVDKAAATIDDIIDISAEGRKFIQEQMGNGAASIEEAIETYNASRRQFRLIPTLTVDDATLKQIVEAGDFIEPDDVVRGFGNREFTYEMGIIDRAAQKEGIIGEVGRALQKFTTNFKNLFSLTGDLPPEFRDMMKGIEGKTMIDLERRSARLASIKKNLVAVDPKAGEYLSELFEAGAYIDEAGQLRRMKRDYGLNDFFDYVFKRNTDGTPIILPEFADQATKNNFIRQINDLYYDYTSMINFKGQPISTLRNGKNLAFDVVESNGGTKLVVENLGSGELKEFTTWLANTPRATNFDNFVHFGQKRLSKGAVKLIKENTGQYQEASRLMDDILQSLVKEGGFVDIPQKLAGQMGYMRHIMSKEAYESLRLTLPGVASKFSRKGSDLLQSRVFVGSIDEVNAGLREFSKLDVDLFDPDAFNAMEDLIKVTQRKVEQKQMLSLVLDARGKNGQRLFRVADNTVAARRELAAGEVMLKSFDEEFPTLLKNLSDGSKKELEGILKNMGFGKDTALVMHKNARDILKRVEKAYIDLPEFVKGYDKLLNTWKGLTLITPGFHMRNLFGNSFNSYAVGMDLAAQSRYATKAMLELDEFTKIGRKLASGAELTVKEKEIYKLVSGFYESGVAQTHRGIRDLEQIKEAVSQATKGGALKTGYNNIIRFNFNVAEKMDDFQRYMLYRWALDKTGDSIKASRTVAESLFDYHHLTNFEKDYMKRLFPFYTFMKNNFVFQAKNIFNNPKAYARTGRTYKYGLENLAGYGPNDLPDYATENMWIPIPISVNKNDKEAVAFLKANLPLADFTELVENPFKKGVISLTAPAKLLIEFGVGRDLFTGQPLSAFPGQTNAMEAGTGVLSGLRDRRGNLTITQSPIAQKILNDIGLRTPINVASAGLDVLDTLTGYQGAPEGFGDFLQRAGIAGVQDVDNLELTQLYQDLEKLRELKKYYEQETGNQLPVLPRG